MSKSFRLKVLFPLIIALIISALFIFGNYWKPINSSLEFIENFFLDLNMQNRPDQSYSIPQVHAKTMDLPPPMAASPQQQYLKMNPGYIPESLVSGAGADSDVNGDAETLTVPIPAQAELRELFQADSAASGRLSMGINQHPIPDYSSMDQHVLLSEVMVVGIDESSITNSVARDQLGNFPYPREIYAEYISNFRLDAEGRKSYVEAIAKGAAPDYFAFLTPDERDAWYETLEQMATENLILQVSALIEHRSESEFQRFQSRQNELYSEGLTPLQVNNSLMEEFNEYMQPHAVLFDLFLDLPRTVSLFSVDDYIAPELVETMLEELYGPRWTDLTVDQQHFLTASYYDGLLDAQEDLQEIFPPGDDKLGHDLATLRARYQQFQDAYAETDSEIAKQVVVGGFRDNFVFFDVLANHVSEGRLEYSDMANRYRLYKPYTWSDEDLRSGSAWDWDENQWRQHQDMAAAYRNIGSETVCRTEDGVRICEESGDRITFSDLKPPIPSVLEHVGGAGPPNVIKLDKSEGERARYMPMIIYAYDDRGIMESYRWIPTVSLQIAMHHYKVRMDDVEIKLGESITLHNAMVPTYEETMPDGTVRSGYGLQPPRCMELNPAYIRADHCIRDKADFFKVHDRVKQNVVIPIDELGRMRINFYGGPRTFPYRPFIHFHPRINPLRQGWEAYKNRLPHIGIYSSANVSEQNQKDTHQTPMGTMFGIEILATVSHNLIHQDFVYTLAGFGGGASWIDLNLLFVLISIFAVAFFTIRLSIINSSIFFVLLVAVQFIVPMATYQWLDTPLYMETFQLLAGSLSAFLAVTLFRIFTESREKQQIKGMFSNYVNAEVVDQLVSNPDMAQLGGIDREMTVFFSDIRSFTSMSEKLTPQELVEVLNLYLGDMTDIVMHYNGTLDKYIGDAVMAFWGAPLDMANHALAGCEASLKMLDQLKEINKVIHKPVSEGGLGKPDVTLRIGVGLNTGKMTVGNMGSAVRKNYTVMGDAVNLGSRLEGTNKVYTTQIIISESTYEHVKDDVIVRELDIIRVKGKLKPVRIYELIAIKDGHHYEPDANIKRMLAKAR